MSAEIFKSSMCPGGSTAGVFEYDGETGYFYLYDLSRDRGKQVTGSIHIVSDDLNFSEADIQMRWSNCNKFVGLYIQKVLWAVFGLPGQNYGGNYVSGADPMIPAEVASSF